MDRKVKEGAHLFRTYIGMCCIAWTEKGIERLVLPGKNEKHTKNLMAKAMPGCVFTNKLPAEIKNTIKRIKSHLNGKLDSLQDIKIDLTNSSKLAQKVYKILRKTKPGTVLSYKDLATRAGSKGASRAVGSFMAKNPIPIIIPCHRVITSSGKLGRFSAYAGETLKLKLLEIEGYK